MDDLRPKNKAQAPYASDRRPHHLPDQMIWRHHLVEIKRVKELALCTPLPSIIDLSRELLLRSNEITILREVDRDNQR